MDAKIFLYPDFSFQLFQGNRSLSILNLVHFENLQITIVWRSFRGGVVGTWSPKRWLEAKIGVCSLLHESCSLLHAGDCSCRGSSWEREESQVFFRKNQNAFLWKILAKIHRRLMYLVCLKLDGVKTKVLEYVVVAHWTIMKTFCLKNVQHCIFHPGMIQVVLQGERSVGGLMCPSHK